MWELPLDLVPLTVNMVDVLVLKCWDITQSKIAVLGMVMWVHPLCDTVWILLRCGELIWVQMYGLQYQHLH